MFPRNNCNPCFGEAYSRFQACAYEPCESLENMFLHDRIIGGPGGLITIEYGNSHENECLGQVYLDHDRSA